MNIKNTITLKFGRLKYDNVQSSKAIDLVKKYESLTPYSKESRETLVKLIKINSDNYILNEFNDKKMTKKEAIQYVLNYENKISQSFN